METLENLSSKIQNPLKDWDITRMWEVFNLFERLEGYSNGEIKTVCDVVLPYKNIGYGAYDGVVSPQDMIYLIKRFHIAKKVYRTYGITVTDCELPNVGSELKTKAIREAVGGQFDEDEDPDIFQDFLDYMDNKNLNDFCLSFTDFSDIGDWVNSVNWGEGCGCAVWLAVDCASDLLGTAPNSVVSEIITNYMESLFNPYGYGGDEEELAEITAHVLKGEYAGVVADFDANLDGDSSFYYSLGFFVYTSESIAKAYKIVGDEIRRAEDEKREVMPEMALFENVLSYLAEPFIRNNMSSSWEWDVSDEGIMTFFYISAFNEENGEAVGTPPVFLRCGLRFYAMVASELAERIINNQEGGKLDGKETITGGDTGKTGSC